MAKTRFIYTTDDKIISGATKLRPKQIPNPPPPPERFSDDENVTKVLHLEDDGLVFAIVKGFEVSFENGPAVNPLYTLYVYDPEYTILTPKRNPFQFVQSDNGWRRLVEVDSQSSVKVVNLYKVRELIATEELSNIYKDRLFFIANVNNQTILTQLDFSSRKNILMSLEIEQKIKDPSLYYKYYDRASIKTLTTLGSRDVLNYNEYQDIKEYVIPWVESGGEVVRCRNDIPVLSDNYTNLLSNTELEILTTEEEAILKFWNDNFLLDLNQIQFIKNTENTNIIDRITSQILSITSRKNVYCVTPNIGWQYRNRYGKYLINYNFSLKNDSGVAEEGFLTLNVPTLQKYIECNSKIVRVADDPLIKKIICFDDYKKVYAICSQVSEPNNSLYRIR